jgi:hypothetical protein
MGAWDTEPFDNDSAADFAGDVGATPEEERHEFLRQALQKVQDGAGRPFDAEYEFPYECEHAIAAAAFLADAHKGVRKFTDTVYAMVLDESKSFKDDDAWSPIEVPKPPQDLVDLAISVMKELVKRMLFSRVDREWIDPVERIIKALGA